MINDFDLVIFDCDGVVVDSEVLTTQILIEMCAELGLSFDEKKVFKTFIGRSNKSCEAALEEELGRPAPADFFVDFHDRVFARYETDLKEVLGVRHLLESLENKAIKFCLASSGDFSKINKGLSICGLVDYFEGRIFSAQEVAHGKPAPDLFLYAADQMAVPAGRCVVIEDSRPGVLAATAAGMSVLGFAERSDDESLLEAGAKIVYSMSEVSQLLFN